MWGILAFDVIHSLNVMNALISYYEAVLYRLQINTIIIFDLLAMELSGTGNYQ